MDSSLFCDFSFSIMFEVYVFAGNDHDNFKLYSLNTSQGLRGNKSDIEFGIHWCYVFRSYTIAKALKFFFK